MPRSHKPSKVSQALTRRSSGKSPVSGNSRHCPKSPTGGHWWWIESPSGVTGIGVCRYCGEQKVFANTMDEGFSRRRK